MIPVEASVFIKLKSPKKMTMSPAVLKKIPDDVFFRMLSELKLIIASTGSVPSAKASMVSEPVQKLPVVSV